MDFKASTLCKAQNLHGNQVAPTASKSRAARGREGNCQKEEKKEGEALLVRRPAMLQKINKIRRTL